MNCDMDGAPMIGLLNQVMHMGMLHAKHLFGKYDLKPWQAGILFILSKEGEMSQRQLATMLNLTPPSITAAIQKMEKSGYIVRQPDPDDQRVMRISLTEKSHDYLEHVFEVSNQIENTAMKGISAEEKMLMRRLLLQMRDNLAESKDMRNFPAPPV